VRLLFSHDFGTLETRVFFVPRFTTQNLYNYAKENTTKIDAFLQHFVSKKD